MIAAGALAPAAGKAGEPAHQRRCLTPAASASRRELIERPRPAASASSMKKRTRPATMVKWIMPRCGPARASVTVRIGWLRKREQQPAGLCGEAPWTKARWQPAGAGRRWHAPHGDGMAVDQLGCRRPVEHRAERIAADHAELERRAGAGGDAARPGHIARERGRKAAFTAFGGLRARRSSAHDEREQQEEARPFQNRTRAPK